MEDQPGARIAFDVLVKADYEVSERTGVWIDILKRRIGLKFPVR